MLVAAGVAISDINDIDDFAHNVNGTFEHANSYRGAAGWLILVGVAAIIFNGVMICVRIMYFAPTIQNYFSGYAFVVSNIIVNDCVTA